MEAKKFQPSTFGKYFLLERIAAGGMAEVYRAVLRGHGGFEKVVALKRILPIFSEEREFVTLFEDEARIASTLTHTNVAQVFDFGVVEGSHYLTMELIEGVDLARLQDRLHEAEQPMPFATAAFLLAEAARGLAYAHEKKGPDGKLLGIIHRDVSPQNVLISYAGEVKVTDFGIARAAGKAHKTATGVVMGKLRYMSPEQVAGAALDPRSDIFSLGVILYELLTGGPVFPGEETVRLAELIHTADIPPPSARNPAVPEELDRITLKALARDREARYGRAADLARELSVYVNQSAPGFTREDLGALVARLSPPRDDGHLPLMPTEATPMERPHGRPSSSAFSGVADTVVDAPQREGSGAPAAATVPPTRAVRQLDVPTRTALPEEEDVIALDKPLRKGKKARKKKSLSREGLVGIVLAVIILASGGLVLARFILPSEDRIGLLPDGPSGVAVGVAADAAPADAAPPGPADVPELVAAGGTPEKKLLRRLKKSDAIRRGTLARDYLVFLTALDFRLATLLVDDKGRAAGSDPLPEPLKRRLEAEGLDDELETVMTVLRTTGKLPREVEIALRDFVNKFAAVDLDPEPETVPPYSAAALAYWLDPTPEGLEALAKANARFGRFCDAAPAGRRRLARILCHRQTLLAALDEVSPASDTLEALRRHEDARPYQETITVGEATLRLAPSWTKAGRRARLVVDVTFEGVTDKPSLAAHLLAGDLPDPIPPRAGLPPLGATGTLEIEVPRGVYAPVLRLRQGNDTVDVRLPEIP